MKQEVNCSSIRQRASAVKVQQMLSECNQNSKVLQMTFSEAQSDTRWMIMRGLSLAGTLLIRGRKRLIIRFRQVRGWIALKICTVQPSHAKLKHFNQRVTDCHPSRPRSKKATSPRKCEALAQKSRLLRGISWRHQRRSCHPWKVLLTKTPTFKRLASTPTKWQKLMIESPGQSEAMSVMRLSSSHWAMSQMRVAPNSRLGIHSRKQTLWVFSSSIRPRCPVLHTMKSRIRRALNLLPKVRESPLRRQIARRLSTRWQQNDNRFQVQTFTRQVARKEYLAPQKCKLLKDITYFRTNEMPGLMDVAEYHGQ